MKTYKILQETEKAIKLLVKCYYVSTKESSTSVINTLLSEKSDLKVTEYEYGVWCPKSAIGSNGDFDSWFIKQTINKFRGSKGISFANESGFYETIYA